MGEEWKIHSLEPQVSEGQRHPGRQEEMGNSEGLETEKTNSWHIRMLWRMSFTF